jgi:UDP-glucose 4-epimerase
MILVTGSSGFVGQALCQRLHQEGLPFRAAVRAGSSQAWPEVSVNVSSLDASSDWTAALQNVHTVVHLAARVHVMNDTSADPLAEFRRVNVEGTRQLATQAAAAGVKRLVFVSSIKVNGESTQPGHPFTADDTPAPQDAYGISKHEAEDALREVAKQTGLEVVILRPPLVYGPGVKANFEGMMRWLKRGLPLPLQAICHNRRSLVALDNLVDVLVLCLTVPAAAHQTFLVSDGDDLSTSEMLTRMGQALGTPARLFYIPTCCLKWGAFMLGKSAVYQRLCGSLQVDIQKTRERLGWTPRVSVDQGFAIAAQGLQT